MSKKDNGISMVTLVITMVLMIIMISMVVNSGIESIEETNVTKIENEIRMLKEAMNIRITNHERNEYLYPLIGEKVGDEIYNKLSTIAGIEPEVINRIKDNIEYSQESEDLYREIDATDAKQLGVDGINVEHRYILDYNDCEVYGPLK